MSTPAEQPEPPTVSDGSPVPEVINLSPTEDLIIDLLVARRRLGYHIQQVPSVNRRALRRLADLGLIGHDHGNIDKHDKVWLTETGLVYGMDPTLNTPALGPDCRSFYMGPDTNDHRIDCARRNHHKGKHCAPWWTRKETKKGTATVRKTAVKWDDAHAGGYASERYGDEMRAHDVEFAAKIAAARERFGVPVPDPDSHPEF